MARDLLCPRCTEEFRKTSHVHDPGWTFRLVEGIAKQPTQAQRTITINGEPHPMSIDVYSCDRCNADIKPGDPCSCRTMIPPGQGINSWEQEYLENPRQSMEIKQ